MADLRIDTDEQQDQAPDTETPEQVVDRCTRDWDEARRSWQPVREKARKARDYYHMAQWTEKQKETLKGLDRPAIVINLIGKAVDNICGRERANRADFKAAPTSQSKVLAAFAMTSALKAVSRQVKAGYRISEAFEHAVLGPMGWGEVGYDDSDPDQEPEVVDAPDPEEMYYDLHSRRMDLNDAKYVIRRRAVDVQDAIDLAPHLEDEIRAAASEKADDDDDLDQDSIILGDYNNMSQPDTHWGTIGLPATGGRTGRLRVALREHQWWRRESVQWMEERDGTRHYITDLDHQSYAQLVQAGATLEDGKRKVYYQAILVGKVLLYHGRMSIPLGRYTYAALFAKKDRKGRPYGLVERAIPPQEEVNVARSKLNESIRSRHLIYQRGSLGSDLPETEVAARLASANFVLPVDSVQGVILGSDKSDITAWLELMREAKTEIDAVFGNNEAGYGDKSQEISGVAQKVRIQQQAQNLGGIFDNLRYFRQSIGEMLLVVIQKTMTPEKLARIIGGQLATGASPVRMGLDGQPAPQQPVDASWLHPLLAGPLYENRFDVELEDQAETGTEREQEMQQRMDLLALVPDGLKGAMLPDTLRASDWEGADAMAAKVEQQMQAQPPAPRIEDQVRLAGADLTPYEIGQVLSKQGMQPDPSRQPGQASAAQARAQTPDQAPPPLDPNKALEVGGRIKVAELKHGHEAQQNAAAREHEATLSNIGRTHDELMAQQAHAHGQQLAQLQAQHQQQQAALVAQLQPPAPPASGGASS